MYCVDLNEEKTFRRLTNHISPSYKYEKCTWADVYLYIVKVINVCYINHIACKILKKSGFQTIFPEISTIKESTLIIKSALFLYL